MARAYSRLLRLGEAMRCLRLLRERQPDNIEALLLTAEVIQQGGGEIDKAGADYRRALELDPQRDDARLKLAQLLVRDHYREAREHFEYLLARKPDDEEVMLGLALAQRALGDSEGKARPLLEAVLARAPDNSKALSELGAMELADGHTQEAEALLRRAVASNPTNHLAHLRLYYCLTRQADKESEAAEQIARYERVKADLERFGQIVSKELMRKPKDANLHSEIGKFYLTYGKPQAGLRWLYRALKLAPMHRTSHRLLYEYYKQQGDLERAEAHRTQTGPNP